MLQGSIHERAYPYASSQNTLANIEPLIASSQLRLLAQACHGAVSVPCLWQIRSMRVAALLLLTALADALREMKRPLGVLVVLKIAFEEDFRKSQR